MHYDWNVVYRRIKVSNLRKCTRKFRTEKLMTSEHDGRYFSGPPPALKFIIDEED
jgi:hypothetical protein